MVFGAVEAEELAMVAVAAVSVVAALSEVVAALNSLVKIRRKITSLINK